jgi:hypothetical protein
MKVILPVEITGSMIASSTVPEPDTANGEAAYDAAFNSGTGYGTGAEVVYTDHYVYQRLAPGGPATTGEYPGGSGWKRVRPARRWAAFDGAVGTVSTSASGTWQVVLDAGACTGLFLGELQGDQLVVQVHDAPGGTLVYTRTVSLQLSHVGSWLEYFTAPFVQRTTVMLTDLPFFSSQRITITVTGSGTVGCGLCIPGKVRTIGSTAVGVQVGDRAFDEPDVDAATGAVTLKPGRKRRRVNGTAQVTEGAINATNALLLQLEGRFYPWLVDEAGEIEPLLLYGFKRVFRQTYVHRHIANYTFEIEEA